MNKTWVIYRHLCKINGKSYIGMTCKKPPETRWYNGSQYKQNTQPAFYNAIKKYGWDNFDHLILEENIESLQTAYDREQYWIAYYHTWIYDPDCNGYNITKGGCGTSGHKVFDEVCKKISVAHKGKPKPPVSADTRKKISNSKKICGNGHTGKKYINNGQECYCVAVDELSYWFSQGFVLGRITSVKAMQNLTKGAKKVYCIELDTTFSSITEAAKALGLQIGKISLCCTGKRIQTGGYHFKFIEEN